MKLLKKTKFAATAFDLNDEIFLLYIVFFINFNLDVNIYSFYKTKIALLKVEKTLIILLFEYTDFIDIFVPNFVAELPKYIGINNYLIYLINS